MVPRVVRRFIRDESGATAIEYGLIAALLAVGIIVALRFMSGNLSNTYNHVATQFPSAGSN